MGAAAPKQRTGAEDYLLWERTQPERHEFHRGEVFAMAGGSARHNDLCNAMGAERRAALRRRGCHVLSADQRISAAAGERDVYADAVVACGGLRIEPGTTDVLANLGERDRRVEGERAGGGGSEASRHGRRHPTR